MGVTCVADSIPKAREGAYQLVKQIHFEGMHYRKDIAKWTSMNIVVFASGTGSNAKKILNWHVKTPILYVYKR